MPVAIGLRMNVAEMFMYRPHLNPPLLAGGRGEGRAGYGNRPALAVVGFGTADGSFGLASDTTVPGVSRYWPRTTTVSPALRPLSISAAPLSVSRTETSCIATL